MAIYDNDLKLLESEVMADLPEGGGRRTARVIPDGVAGNVFPKVSRLDAVYGRVNLRKIYGAVVTPNTDVYAGAHAIITDAPDNGRIHCTLFSTGSEYDVRTDARSRMESYLAAATESRMVLLGRHLAGQRAISCYQRLTDPLPEIGQVYCLSVENGGDVIRQQYFRIQSVDALVGSYTDATVDFERREITLTIDSPLRYDFNGVDAVTRTSNVTRPTLIRRTLTADAARFYGIKPLTAPVAAGAMTVKVDSPYAQIVPTTTRETPISEARLDDAPVLVAAGAVRRLNAAVALAVGAQYHFPRAFVPASLQVFSASTSRRDDGAGKIVLNNGPALVDYDAGLIESSSATASWSWSEFIPAAPVAQAAHTKSIPVTVANRGLVYTISLRPLPAPGSVRMDFRALGKWYRLSDDGVGAVVGDDGGVGQGRIDYTTGAMVVTLGALPDVGSALLLSFGTLAHYDVRAGAMSDARPHPYQVFTVPDLPVKAGSLTAVFLRGGVECTVTDDGAGGLSGPGVSGSIDYVTGKGEIVYTGGLPDVSTSLRLAWRQVAPLTAQDWVAKSQTHQAGDTMLLDDIGQGIKPGSLRGTLPFSLEDEINKKQTITIRGWQIVHDDGQGIIWNTVDQNLLVDPNGSAAVMQQTVLGRIDYDTGEIVIEYKVPVSYRFWRLPVYAEPGEVTALSTGEADYGWVNKTAFVPLGGGYATFSFMQAGTTNVAYPEKTLEVDADSAPIYVDLLSTTGDALVPGSLLFDLAGNSYFDRDGALYYKLATNTGAASLAGSVDYDAGRCRLTAWTVGLTSTVAVLACLTSRGTATVSDVAFRIPGAPVRAGSFFIRATTIGGGEITATGSEAGVVSGDSALGTVDHENGVVRVRFGELVDAAGNESAPWFNAGAVVAGKIWMPIAVLPTTIAYSAVALANLPLDADLLGLDPVRLPADGRVPILRPSEVAVLHHTQAFTLPNPVAPAMQYALPRAGLSDGWVVDQDGKRLGGEQYDVDLESGVVTMADVLDMSTYRQPLVAHHRIDEMALIADTQITGEITFATAIERAFPAGTLISSALRFGDLYAHVSTVHDLLTFTGWSDEPGPPANAGFNKIDFPIEVLNNGAVTERWRLSFTSPSAFSVVGETLGFIASGTVTDDCAPVNRLTGLPYFVIRAAGFGSGWAAGNQLRFNTHGASAPIWIARTILPGASTEADSFTVQLRGDIDG